MSELPKGWAKANLLALCQPKQWKVISTAELTEAGYVVYGANGKIGFYSTYTHEHPTLMITCRGATCGNLHVSEPRSYINGNAMALDNLAEQATSIGYLRYALLARGLTDAITGTAQPQITRQSLSDITIKLAPLAEQTRIAANARRTAGPGQYPESPHRRHPHAAQTLSPVRPRRCRFWAVDG